MPAWRGWAPLVALPAAILLLWPRHWPAWLLMWVLTGALFVGCKWLTWRRTPAPGAPWWRHLGYLVGWPGMDAEAFLGARGAVRVARPTLREWGMAAAWLLAGLVLFWGARWLAPPGSVMLLGWLGMVGMMLVVHFGVSRLLGCAWRARGVQARPLMDAPLKAISVSEFWGRRWNTAFRDFTHRFLFRPLSGRLGPRGALVAGFVFSGFFHELIISVPARGGYGWPTLFFALQAAALLAERSPAGRALGLGRGWRGRLFTWLVLAVPVYGLFHPPYVHGVIVPFMRAVGAA